MSPGTAAAEIVFDHVTKRYPGQKGPAVDDLSLTIPAGEICVLIGPSGGGKTTAMKLVNRLIPLTEGDITIDGTSILDLDPVQLRRGIGYVIQQIGLFPHMTIEANVDRAPASCSSSSASTPRSTPSATPPSSRAGSASASAWPGRWPPTRR
jgi:osmoprotectant transport system ATP-binding protein